MRVGLCQIDTTVGDFEGNRDRILRAARDARRAGAQCAIFPELAVTGYPSEDLFRIDAFVAQNDAVLAELAAGLPPDLPVLIGCLERNENAGAGGGRPLHNAVALLEDGIVRIVARKTLLPTYDVFDESRYFEPWDRPETNVVTIGGRRFGITVCEDVWNDPEFASPRLYSVDPVERVASAGVDVIVNVSASPWNRLGGEGKERFRLRMLQSLAKRHGVPFLFVNLVGGNVDLQFDGTSAGIGSGGLANEPVTFGEDVAVVDLGETWQRPLPDSDLTSLHYAGVVQGLRAYSAKFGIERAVLGLSGGIDSALTAALAVDALGADNVTGIGMPSTFSSQHSRDDARALAENLGMPFHEIPIRGLQTAFDDALADVFAGTAFGIAEENVQSRARGALVMAVANKFGGMALTTGNKSEAAVGYCTLYGDTVGALAPIADLWKTQVWDLSRWINRDGERIPVASIEKPPSAELREDQLDTDSLPPYDVLDPVLEHLVEREQSVAETVAATGVDRALVARVASLVAGAEFKRRQYPPTIRLSGRGWTGRRMPVSHRYRER